MARKKKSDAPVEAAQEEKKFHFTYGGSAMARIIACTASPKAISELPKRESGEAAARGTRIHTWLERYLKGDFASAAKKGDKKDQEEAAIAAAAGLKIKEIIGQYGIAVSQGNIEKTYVLKSASAILGGDKAGGTPDYDFAIPFKSLVVIDYKSGRNYVDADKNWQGRFYGNAAYDNLSPFVAATLEQFIFIVVQSNQEAPYDCRVQVFQESIVEMRKANETIVDKLWEAEVNPVFTAGPHCEALYCDARTTCPAHQAYANDRSFGMLGAVITQDLQKLAQGWSLVQILQAKEALEPLFKQADTDANNQLKVNPLSVPGYGLHSGVGHRKWDDEAQVQTLAKAAGMKIDDYMPRSLVSPAQYDALLIAYGKDQTVNENGDLIFVPKTTKPATAAKVVKLKEEATDGNPFTGLAKPPTVAWTAPVVPANTAGNTTPTLSVANPISPHANTQ